MNNTYFIIFFSLILALSANAQKKGKSVDAPVPVHDTIAYYMVTDYQMANAEQDARFLRLIIKADSGMFNIQDFYMDGKKRLIARSSVNNSQFQNGVQGNVFEYHQNGFRKSIKKYHKGKLTGDAIKYYTNGLPYAVENYDTDTVFLKEYQDSTGKVLAENGNGMWRIYSDEFKTLVEEGPVSNGKRHGNWKEYDGDSIYNTVYTLGKMKFDSTRANAIFKSAEVEPKFNQGDQAFGMFLARAIYYPAYAREHGIQGRVVLSFIVEKNGTLTDIQLVRSVHETLDSEAIRAMKMSPPWIPGTIAGRPVRVRYAVPIGFALAQE